MEDAVKKGRQAKGFMLPQTKLGENHHKEIMEMVLAGVPYKNIAAHFGVGRQRIGQIAIKNGVRRYGK